MGFALSDIQITSNAFENNAAIPLKYTGEGVDVSPQLSWQNAPTDAKGFAVLCHDPDAPLISAEGSYGYVHWSVYNIPGDVTSLNEGNQEYTQGLNDFGKTEYGGPMPPEGHGQHKYYFWILALDQATDLPAKLSFRDLLQKLEPHVIAMNRLVGTYQRD
jgi:Raf kinase inhibitor-like YbhB/YbcL family protein